MFRPRGCRRIYFWCLIGVFDHEIRSRFFRFDIVTCRFVSLWLGECCQAGHHTHAHGLFFFCDIQSREIRNLISHRLAHSSLISHFAIEHFDDMKERRVKLDPEKKNTFEKSRTN